MTDSNIVLTLDISIHTHTHTHTKPQAPVHTLEHLGSSAPCLSVAGPPWMTSWCVYDTALTRCTAARATRNNMCTHSCFTRIYGDIPFSGTDTQTIQTWTDAHETFSVYRGELELLVVLQCSPGQTVPLLRTVYLPWHAWRWKHKIKFNCKKKEKSLWFNIFKL